MYGYQPPKGLAGLSPAIRTLFVGPSCDRSASATPSSARVIDKGEGQYWTVLSGQGVGGAYKVAFTGHNAEKAARSLANVLNLLRDIGAFNNASR